MRQLTQKQKVLLEKWLNEAEPTLAEKAMGISNPIKSADDLTSEQYEELEKINDTEILYRNVNSFITDWRWHNIVNN